MTMIQALRSAMDVMMERDDNVIVYGRTWATSAACSASPRACRPSTARRAASTRRSRKRHRRHRHRHGAYGLRPVVEIQFADYFYPATDQIVSEAARLRHRSAGDFTAPMTIRMPCGGGIYGGQTHSQSPEACSPTSAACAP
jgi:2-oxoisovalerate dehydrogenase E1 component beta subunit